MKKTKVLYIINDLMIGGAQSLVLNLCKDLDKNLFEVQVLYLYDFELKKTTYMEVFREIGIIPIHLNAKKNGIFAKIKACISYIKTQKPDIVHLHLPDAVMIGSFASILTGAKFVIHEHNTHTFHSWKIKLMLAMCRPFALLTICYAESVEREVFGTSHVLFKADDVTGQKIVTIPNGVDVRPFRDLRTTFVAGGRMWKEKRASLGIGIDKIVIFSAARFVAWKGHEHLVNAFLSVRDKNPNLVLVIAGEGPEKKYIEEIIKKNNASEVIRLIGARTDVSEILMIADIYSLVFSYEKHMQHAEAIGLSGFEAMAAGLPTIIGDYGSAHVYMENMKNGIIVDPYNIDALGDVFIQLASDADLRKTIGNGATKKILEILDWCAIIRIYERIYQHITTS